MNLYNRYPSNAWLVIVQLNKCQLIFTFYKQSSNFRHEQFWLTSRPGAASGSKGLSIYSDNKVWLSRKYGLQQISEGELAFFSEGECPPFPGNMPGWNTGRTESVRFSWIPDLLAMKLFSSQPSFWKQSMTFSRNYDLQQISGGRGRGWVGVLDKAGFCPLSNTRKIPAGLYSLIGINVRCCDYL